MQHRIRSGRHAAGAQLAGGGAKQRQQFRGAGFDVFVILSVWLPLFSPGGAGIGDRLVRAGFVLTPDLDALRFSRAVGTLNQAFFSSVSGSDTRTTPSLRTRLAMPVGHQLRVRWDR